jgi:hypothetical protein
MIMLLLTLGALVRSIRSGLRDPTFHILFICFGALLVGGCVFYVHIEGWSVIDALYFCMASMSTVGYGDVSPQTDMGKIFTIGYLLLGTGTYVAMAARLAAAIVLSFRYTHGAAAQSRHESDPA